MRYQLGMMGCLLAGCAVQPTTSSRSFAMPSPTGASSIATAGTFAAEARQVAEPPSLVLRIGVEHLPPDARAADEQPRLEAVPRPPDQRRDRRAARPVVRPREAHEVDLLRREAAAAQDTLAREALLFVGDMVAADRDRARTEVGIPFFDFRRVDEGNGPPLNSDLALQADHEEWVQQHGASLLNRPLRRLFRRLPVVQQLELEFENFRSDHVPLSEPYVQAHGDRGSFGGLGRISVRLRASELDDPVEVAWVHRSGLRIGTSQETGRIALDLALLPNVRLELRARTDYETEEHGLRADLSYRPSPSTSLHLAIGDDMDFLTTSSIYSLFESPMDGSPGLVLYAVHTF